MNCPRCQLPNSRTALACARCGEATPRPNATPFETRPPADGPRYAPGLGRDVGIDRRGRGVRAVNVPLQTPPPPVRVRQPATPAWSRPARGTPPPPVRIIAASALSPDQAPLHFLPMPSVVAQAKTEPNWHREPEDAPERAEPPAEDAAPAAAPIGRRALAAAVDAGVVAGATLFALGLGVAVLGPALLAPQVARGFDFVVDGLLLGRGVLFVALAFALVLAFTYLTLAHALGGATLGKHLTGLRLVGPDGAGITLRESAWRTLACAGSTVLGFGGLVYAAFDPSRRTLHDLLVGTRVVDVRVPAPDDAA